MSVWWIKETLKTPRMQPRLDSMTLLQLAFPGEGNLNFPWEKFHWNTVVKSKKKRSKSELEVKGHHCFWGHGALLSGAEALSDKKTTTGFMQLPGTQ